MNSKRNISKSIYTGFIDQNMISLDEYHPKLLVNDYKIGSKVLTNLINELRNCDEFYFSVAFVTNSGVQSLYEVLKDLENKGIKGKIVASQYQNFTEPSALRRLNQFRNIELKILTDCNFHAKGYIFKKEDHFTVIIGSSNLTQDALSKNREWNLRVSSFKQGDLASQIIKAFNETFENATKVDEAWICEYEKIYDQKEEYVLREKVPEYIISRISPNKMQTDALTALEKLRSENKNKALLISATGTGKTYLSAFDVMKFNPGKFLFIIHRENVARAAKESYKRIFGNTRSMGLLTGNSKDYNSDFIFATIQTLSQDHVLSRFKPEYFDYIVIDEVHRSGASTYQKILDHFRPKFLFGMTATPERTDGFDVFQIFDHNIAYEIRLYRALEENMLCTFHYYGISEIQVNGELLDDNTSFNRLVCDARVEHIIETSKQYGCCAVRIKGLVFCSRKDEAAELSKKFNAKGFKTIFLSGDSSEEEREESIELLESADRSRYLDYIFTVDIFNEGVDIPSINQIIMLRPTQSSIIFVQQLGRGLRKLENKEFLVVLDFIGNYNNNYLIPIALYGDNTYNKDSLRKLMRSGSSYIPGASTINFDPISKQKIFNAIDNASLSRKKDLRIDYDLMKYRLGIVPMMVDFERSGSRDPFLYVECSKSYYNFVSEIEEIYRGKLSDPEKTALEFFSMDIANAKRIEEVILLKDLIQYKTSSHLRLAQLMNDLYGHSVSLATYNSCLDHLNDKFLRPESNKDFNRINAIDFQNEIAFLNPQFSSYLKNDFFARFLIDVIDCSIQKYNQTYSKENYIDGFLLYQKYTRKDACRILNWPKDEASTIYGYRVKHSTCPIFVTYNKDESINSGTKYEDYFINQNEFNWMTRNGVDLNSNEVVMIRNYKENDLRIPLFVKKSDDEGMDFYYMGDMTPVQYQQVTIINHKQKILPIVNIIFRMNQPVDEKIYEYLTRN